MEKFPLEIVANILSYVPAVDHLAVKLVDKQSALIATRYMDTSDLSPSAKGYCHTRLEANFHPDRPMIYLACTRCGLLKRREDFADAEWKNANHERICVRCGIITNKYSNRSLVSEGVWKFPCRRCLRALPLQLEYVGNIDFVVNSRASFLSTPRLCYVCGPLSLAELLNVNWLKLYDIAETVRVHGGNRDHGIPLRKWDHAKTRGSRRDEHRWLIFVVVAAGVIAPGSPPF